MRILHLDTVKDARQQAERFRERRTILRKKVLTAPKDELQEIHRTISVLTRDIDTLKRATAGREDSDALQMGGR